MQWDVTIYRTYFEKIKYFQRYFFFKDIGLSSSFCVLISTSAFFELQYFSDEISEKNGKNREIAEKNRMTFDRWYEYIN